MEPWIGVAWHRLYLGSIVWRDVFLCDVGNHLEKRRRCVIHPYFKEEFELSENGRRRLRLAESGR